jgi:hypothetical protein
MPRKTQSNPAGDFPRSDRLSVWYDMVCDHFDAQVAAGIDVTRDARQLTLLARASASIDAAHRSERRALVDKAKAERDLQKASDDICPEIKPPLNAKAQGDEMELNDDADGASDPGLADRVCGTLDERLGRYVRRLEADGLLAEVMELATERDAALNPFSTAGPSMAA